MFYSGKLPRRETLRTFDPADEILRARALHSLSGKNLHVCRNLRNRRGRAAGYLDGEDARQDGARDANLPAVVQELEESVGSEEQLRDDEIRSGVHLLLEVLEILLVALGLRVSGGVPCRRGKHASASATAGI